MKTDRSADLAALALAGVTVAAALGLARVFADDSFALPIIGAALLPHAIGRFGRGRQWRTSATVVAAVVATFVFCAWVIAPTSTAYGFPGLGAAEELVRLFGDGWHVFRTGHAPVEVTDGVLLLCLVATAAVATVADELAFHAAASIGALVPSLLLFVFTATLGTSELRTISTLGYAAAALVFLMLQQQALLVTRRSWCTGRRLSSDAALVNAGALVGGAALVVGLFLAPALPGSDAGPLLDYRAVGGKGRAGPADLHTLSPLVDIKARLTDSGETELFRVRSRRRLAWRVAALDRFDGTVWGIESHARDANEVLGSRRPRGTERQEYTIGPLGDEWLPAAFEPVAVNLADARIIPESGTLIAPGRDVAGLRYRVDSRIPPANPSADQIAATTAPTPASLRADVELPSGFPESVRRQAQRITAPAATPYERAKRLEAFFLDGTFIYDLDWPGGSSTDAITAFLRTRRGFCEQFAGTFAAMARAVGLPTRVAVGFSPGEYDAVDREFTVRSRDAHAWPEVWLAGLGWTRFEPTPAGPAPGQADTTIGALATAVPDTAATPSSTTAPTTTAPGTPTSRPFPRGEANVIAGGPVRRSTSDDGRRWLVLAAVPLLALLSAFVWTVTKVLRRARRRARRRHAAAPFHSVTGAWQDALERLAVAGLPASDALTPREQTNEYGARGAPAPAVASLRDLADLYAELRWSARTPTGEDVVRAWAAADAVKGALADGASAGERARRALRSPEPVGS